MTQIEAIRVSTMLVLIMLAVILYLPLVTPATTDNLVVRFLDVGQGDSIHVMTPDGYEMLIDGGANSLVLRQMNQTRSVFDREIDLVLATHPDTDHIGGLVDVLERYQVANVMMTDNEGDSTAARAFSRAVEIEGAEFIQATAGQVISLGEMVKIKVLAPLGGVKDWPSNNASVIMQITYGEVDFLFTGDASLEVEDYLVGTYGADLESEVLKLGHHGSKTSTSELFLNTVNPEFAVVSAGADNRYGHPHNTVIDRVEERNIEILETAFDGTITFMSDGSEVWLNK